MFRKLRRTVNNLLAAYALLFAAFGVVQLFKDLVDHFRDRAQTKRDRTN